MSEQNELIRILPNAAEIFAENVSPETVVKMISWLANVIKIQAQNQLGSARFFDNMDYFPAVFANPETGKVMTILLYRNMVEVVDTLEEAEYYE